MIFHKPSRAIVWPSAFFVCRESDNDVAIGLEPFTFITNQIGDPNRGLRLVIRRAAAIEKSVALNKGERIHAPVLPLRFDDIGVSKQKNRFASAGAVIAND